MREVDHDKSAACVERAWHAALAVGNVKTRDQIANVIADFSSRLAIQDTSKPGAFSSCGIMVCRDPDPDPGLHVWVYVGGLNYKDPLPEIELPKCRTCGDVGRVDCCESASCKECGGLFTKDCPDCEVSNVDVRR